MAANGPTTEELEAAEKHFDDLFPEAKVYHVPHLYSTQVVAKKEMDLPNTLRAVSFVDKDKLAKSQDRKRGEEAELKVIKGLEEALSPRVAEEGLGCIIIHNFLKNKEAQCEVDVLLLHKVICVLLIEVKGKEPPCKPLKLKNLVTKARKQLAKAKADVENTLGPQPIKSFVTFPNLTEQDKQELEETIAEEKDVQILFGATETAFAEILRGPSQVFRFTGCDDPTLAFKYAVYRLTSKLVRRPTFGQAVKMCAKDHEHCLLTKEQLEILDSREKFIHIHGPHGAGKSILLVLIAQRWIQRDCTILVLVGHTHLDPLLHSLGEGINAAPKKAKKMHLCRINEFHEEIEKIEGEVHVIADEYTGVHYQDIAKLINQGKISALWSAHVLPLAERDLLKHRELKQCIRCPPSVVDLLNQIDPTWELECFTELPRDIPLNAAPTIICHDPADPKHDHGSFSDCPECERLMTQALRELGLLQSAWDVQASASTEESSRKKSRRGSKEAPEDLHWGDVLIILSGWIKKVEDAKKVEEWFKKLDVPADWERCMEYERQGPIRISDTREDPKDFGKMSPPAANTRSKRSPARREPGAEQELPPPDGWRQRVLKGVGPEGYPRVHFVHSLDFEGLEKYVVIVVHHDEEDLQPDKQTEDRVQERLQEHRKNWYRSVSRCLGKVIVLAATPSPLCRLLQEPRGPGQDQQPMEAS